MNHTVFSEAPTNHHPDGASIAKMAERELGAFFNVVKQLFGTKQAELAANDWLEELEASRTLPVAIREWRLITINAARRLAVRLNASLQYE